MADKQVVHEGILSKYGKRFGRLVAFKSSIVLSLAILASLFAGPELYKLSNTVHYSFGNFWKQLQQNHATWVQVFMLYNLIIVAMLAHYVNKISDGNADRLGMSGALLLNALVGMSRYVVMFIPVYWAATFMLKAPGRIIPGVKPTFIFETYNHVPLL